MTKKAERKPRTDWLYGKTKQSVSSISVEVGPSADDIAFVTDMKDVYSEVTYERPKGPKVVARIPQLQDGTTLSESQALDRNYDILCAVDTNTKTIADKTISVVGIVIAEPVWVGTEDGLAKAWQYDTPGCWEYVEAKGDPEKLGWVTAIDLVEWLKSAEPDYRIGLIVDSDLGALNEINAHKRPIFADRYLSKNAKLIYASADSDKYRLTIKLIAQADKLASNIHQRMESGEIQINRKSVKANWCESSRFLFSPKLSEDIQNKIKRWISG